MILIVDCGSQLTQNIARRIREKNVYCNIIPYNKLDSYIDNILDNKTFDNHILDLNNIKSINQIEGIIISGGPHSIYDKNSPKINKKIFDFNLPILGICYGMQLITYLLDGTVQKQEKREYGKTNVEIINKTKLFNNFLNDNFSVWMSHGDSVVKVPNGFKIIAKTNDHIAVIENIEKQIYATQFHPESDHTENGRIILENFIDICNCKKDWKMSSFIENEIKLIKEMVKDSIVIGGVSGGVDSTTASVLMAKALGNNYIPIFINNGLLRLDEEKEVINLFKSMNIKLNYVDASNEFLENLKGIIDPEQKRKIIGKIFIDLFEREAKKFKANYLMQGTLYPDVVESVPIFGNSDIIKSHHNVGGLPDKLNLKLIEPFKFLFKDEVREIAKELDIPKHIYNRHPFPGPGLSVRIIGEINDKKLTLLRKADKIFIDELFKNNIYYDIWQALCAIFPIKSVGVMGDKKSYEYIIALRAVNSKDGMTADWYKFDYLILETISNRIMNEVKGINRVVYDISSKPPATIEYE